MIFEADQRRQCRVQYDCDCRSGLNISSQKCLSAEAEEVLNWTRALSMQCIFFSNDRFIEPARFITDVMPINASATKW